MGTCWSHLGAEVGRRATIIITEKVSEERAGGVDRAGAFWYAKSQQKGPVLRALLDRSLGQIRDARQLGCCKDSVRENRAAGDLVGAFKAHADVIRIVEMAAPSSLQCITGETGSERNCSANGA